MSTTEAPAHDATDAASAAPVATTDVVPSLQQRLVALLDLQLTLKHVHWNVTGSNFIAVHEMLDPQVDLVRAMSDAVAERIATCGGVPHGTPGAIKRLGRWLRTPGASPPAEPRWYRGRSHGAAVRGRPRRWPGIRPDAPGRVRGR